jgi:glycosyltransferase involved in cell wall biosynthesis
MRTEGILVILTPGFAASEEDTTCLPMQQAVVRTLVKKYPHLQIVVLSFQYPYAEKNYTWNGATVYSFNGRNKGHAHRLLLRRKINCVLTEIHRTGKIIGLLSFWYGECAAVGKLFARKHGLRHCCWLLGQDARKGNKYPKRYPLQAGELIALSDFLQAEFERNYSVKPAHVVPPGVSASDGLPQSFHKDIDILGTGSLIPLKQFDKFILAVAKIKAAIGPLSVVLIGEGPERPKLQLLIHQLALEDTIQLTGELPHPEVTKRMQRTKLLLHPSSYEGFGVVMVEALNSGAQVISFVKPMLQNVENWHIVNDLDEMVQTATAILRLPIVIARTEPVFPIEDTAKKLVDLFSLQ